MLVSIDASIMSAKPLQTLILWNTEGDGLTKCSCCSFPFTENECLWGSEKEIQFVKVILRKNVLNQCDVYKRLDS